MYMKLPYAQGSVTAAGFQDWIEIDSFSFGVSRTLSMEAGAQTTRVNRVAQFSEFTISKYMEESSPPIMDQIQRGASDEGMEIVILEGEDQPREIVRYTLGECIVSAYNVAGSGGRPQESISFVYTKLDVAVKPKTKGNTGAGTVRSSFDLGDR
jgi:type VI secretion system secreted protein Hcp